VSESEPVAVLVDDSFTIPVPGGTAAWRETQRLMARWTNGTEHARRRSVATEALATLKLMVLRQCARALTVEALATATDLTALARLVPVAVLAESLGFTEPLEAARHQREVSRAIAPEEVEPARPDADTDRSMAWLVVASRATASEEAANRVALLHQCMDATAGLILNAYLRWIDHLDDLGDIQDPVQVLIARTLQHTRPVLHTTRNGPGGKAVTVSLADTPFGAGRHQCPGHEAACALAAGVLDALLAASVHHRLRVEGYEPRPNLRIPRIRIDV
jgi:cytochrome P450